jgi:hypothetical protein
MLVILGFEGDIHHRAMWSGAGDVLPHAGHWWWVIMPPMVRESWRLSCWRVICPIFVLLSYWFLGPRIASHIVMRVSKSSKYLSSGIMWELRAAMCAGVRGTAPCHCTPAWSCGVAVAVHTWCLVKKHAVITSPGTCTSSLTTLRRVFVDIHLFALSPSESYCAPQLESMSTRVVVAWLCGADVSSVVHVLCVPITPAWRDTIAWLLLLSQSVYCSESVSMSGSSRGSEWCATGGGVGMVF